MLSTSAKFSFTALLFILLFNRELPDFIINTHISSGIVRSGDTSGASLINIFNPILKKGKTASGNDIFFPPAGEGIQNHQMRSAEEMGLNPGIVDQIREFITMDPSGRGKAEPRWALWRNGYLVHAEGDFNKTVNVASLRKTWHAMTVGAAILLGKIPSPDQKLSVWLPELKGKDADVTWRHIITQSSGFDYPYGSYPDYGPGEMWTYSDWNPVYLCKALARVYGKKDYYDNYTDVVREAYFDAIGMEGWKTGFSKNSDGLDDGIRFHFNLDNMGRLGLLALARGTWNGKELVPGWFVEQLETKQTKGMLVNYNGPNDGKVGLDEYGDRFRESPYGYMTWVNSDRKYFPNAGKSWAWGSGAGGNIVMWNHRNGIVFTCIGFSFKPGQNSIPKIIEQNIRKRKL